MVIDKPPSGPPAADANSIQPETESAAAQLSRLQRQPRFRTHGHYQLGLTGWIIVSGFTIILAVLLRAFVVQTFKIPSESMVPTLLVGDHIIVNRLAYGLYFPGVAEPLIRMKTPGRNDVVVFSKFSEFEDRDASKHYIKRIIGIPGDTVEVSDFRAYINGNPVDKTFTAITSIDPSQLEPGNQNYGPVKLEADQFFVLGDNRVNSQDSRYYGAINRHDIEGRAWIIYWSWDTSGDSYAVRWKRLGKVVH